MQQSQQKEFANLFFGADESEIKREQSKKQRSAHPDFGRMQDECTIRRNQKQLRKKEAKVQNRQDGGRVVFEKFNKVEEQKHETIEDSQKPPRFITLMKGNDEEVQQNLEDFVNQQYKTTTDQKKVYQFMQESDYGDTEYKLRLVNPDINRITHLTTQMNYRLQEGNGVAHYKIGVEDSGKPLGLNENDMLDSLRTLCTMASCLKAEVLVASVSQGLQGKIAEMIVRKGQKEGIKLDVRLLLLGETGSGKTSLLGVMSTGLYDDGKGLARMKILKNPNEILSGKTERVSHTVIGLDSEGRIINHQAQINFLSDSIEKVVDLSSKLITFIDMGGHKRAHNQMIKILNSSFPDYALLVTSATAEINCFTEEYFKLLHVHQLPIMIVVTHVDVASELQIDQVVQDIKRVVEEFKDNRIPIVVRSEQDVVMFSKQILNKLVVPIFLLSNVSGKSINLFVKFLNLLPSNNEHINNANMSPEYYISNTYDTTGNKVLGGTVIKGLIKEKQILSIGPDKKGSFFPIEIEEIQCNRVKVKSAQCGQICTIKFKLNALSGGIGGEGNPIRKGMVLVEGKTNPRAYWEFEAEIWLFDDIKIAKQISYSFQPVINTQTSRQICKIIPQPKELTPLPLLEKQKSRSIDQKSSQTIMKSSSAKVRIENRKQSYDAQQILHHDSPTIPNRKQSYSDQEKSEKPTDETESKLHLFVINEKVDKYETITMVPGHGNIIRLRFMYNPEYIQKGMRLIINEQQFRAVGFIKQLIY